MTYSYAQNPMPMERPFTARDALQAIRTPSLRGYLVDKSVPWNAVDLPMVDVLPQNPKDRMEVNLLVGDGVVRMVYRAATATWYRADGPNLEWIGVSFSTGWSNYGAGFQEPQYSKDHWGIVRLRGLAIWSGAGSALDLGTMPVGYRPAAQELWATPTSVDANAKRIDVVATTGQIAPGTAVGAGGWVSLSPISYEAG